MNTRAAATQVLYDVIENGRSLSDALPEKLKKFSDKRDQALVQALCYEVCRWFFRLDAVADYLLDKPLKEKDQDIHILLLVGLCQLMEMRIPDYAAVGETVAVTMKFKKIWAKNLVNGVLRQYQRMAEEFKDKIANDEGCLYSHPAWYIGKIKKAWPENWEMILNANNQHPPMCLRVNQQYHSRDNYFKILSETLSGTIVPETTSGIILDAPVDVAELPGFSDGHVSVQDGAAQLAAELLMLEPGQRVLDACAAPGGKTTHILEVQPRLAELVAIDKDESRLVSVRENLQRLHLSANCIAADSGDLDAWWDKNSFDRILLDVPCSASGVIRRHPDIKILRRVTDIATLVNEQKQLLNSIWQCLKVDGILLYASCSVFKDENEKVIEAFLASHPDAKEEKIHAEWGKACSVGRQILPGMHNMDGFYYARLRKVS